MIRMGVLCPSEIAYRRFMPALSAVGECCFAGIGVSSPEERFLIAEEALDAGQREVLRGDRERAEAFVRQYGGKVFGSYGEVVDAPEIDAVYIPLPPALHFAWAKRALENGKHVLVEKPATLTGDCARQLTAAAEAGGLALHENYMFAFHDQLRAIREYIDSGRLGDVRLYRVAFGFPLRARNDFRYDRALGGGALIDCGGYTIKYASMLLGESARLVQAVQNGLDGFEVDMYGSAVMINDRGLTAHLAFGMDNDYKCELEVWGSRGTLRTDRVLTAPAGYVPRMTVRFNGAEEVVELPADDAFQKSLRYFLKCIGDDRTRREAYGQIERQAAYIDDFCRLSGGVRPGARPAEG